MTNLADLDRALTEFLEDGPNTAPEAPVIAAMAHARTTPRRPDPFAWLRSDAMAAPRRQILGLRPALILAVVALIGASIGIAVVGSRPQLPAIVVPGSPESPPQPSNLALTSPSPAASLAPQRSPYDLPITMLVSAGQPYPVQVSDTTGALLDGTSLQPGDGASVGNDEVRIVADPRDLAALIVTWSGTPCESSGSLHVDERTHVIEIGREVCEGDALPVDRIMRLQFENDVTAADWTSMLVGVPQPSTP
jgi:hypothetical protein